MFDARSILDILIGGGPQRRSRPTDPSVFKDMLDQLGDQPKSPVSPGRTPTADARPQQAPTGAPQGQQGLEDVLRNILSQIQQGQAQQAPGGRQAAPQPQPGGPDVVVGKDLQDLLRQILEGRSQPGEPRSFSVSRIVGDGDAGERGTGEPGRSSEQGQSGEPLEGLAEALRQILGQATAGVREGAARIDEATGISARSRDAIGQATGRTPEEVIARLREIIAGNQLASGAALGGLGALVLGSRAGRSLAGAAIRLGGLALIGGLAYKAFQNYQQGKPPLAAEKEAKATPQALLPAPEGTGFEAGAVTHDAARRYIRTMIAAAAADGRIDRDEQQRILGGLKQAGLERSAEHFLAAEIANPATVAELASGIDSPEEALQVYTAARIAVDPDSAEEHAFLAALADALGIDEDLARQVDAATRGASGSLVE